MEKKAKVNYGMILKLRKEHPGITADGMSKKLGCKRKEFFATLKKHFDRVGPPGK